jgi:cob(I)alamin adenosyltransferase
MGLTLRCSGGGGKVLVFQFLKNNSSSERSVLEQLPNVKVLRGLEKVKFSFAMSDAEKQEMKSFYQGKFNEIKEQVQTKHFQLLVLDEIIATISLGFLNESEVLDFLKNKPGDLEVVMTGRAPSEKLLEIADYVSSIEKVKHPFDAGVPARKLIEF